MDYTDEIIHFLKKADAQTDMNKKVKILKQVAQLVQAKTMLAKRGK